MIDLAVFPFLVDRALSTLQLRRGYRTLIATKIVRASSPVIARYAWAIELVVVIPQNQLDLIGDQTIHPVKEFNALSSDHLVRIELPILLPHMREDDLLDIIEL